MANALFLDSEVCKPLECMYARVCARVCVCGERSVMAFCRKNERGRVSSWLDSNLNLPREQLCRADMLFVDMLLPHIHKVTHLGAAPL